MGEALIAALLDAKVYTKSAITVVDTRKSRLAQLKKQYGIRVEQVAEKALGKAEVVLLAVKPQDSAALCGAIGEYIPSKAMVISIMAGVPSTALQKQLGHERVVRAMPNTPAFLRMGMTAWMPSSQVTRAQRSQAKKIFEAFGEQLELKTDDQIDAATAVSGSGPAYVFAYAEYLTAAAQKVGFTQKQAQMLVEQTLLGSAQLLVESDDSAVTLREKVTSKKGTTEAALKMFRSKRIGSIIQQGVRAAYKRAKDLARMSQ